MIQAARTLAALLLAAPVALAQQDGPLTPRLTPAGVTASTEAQTGAAGEIKLSLTLKNAGSQALKLSAGRDSLQGCATAPTVRVLKVGTREVVYPDPGQMRLCTQELLTRDLPAGGQTRFERTLNLAPGEYLIESWFQGFIGAEGQKGRLAANPVRVTVAGGAVSNGSSGSATPAASTTGLQLSASVPAEGLLGSAMTATLTIKNTGTGPQSIDANLCPVGIEARPVGGGATIELQNAAAITCLANAAQVRLAPGQSRSFQMPVPPLTKRGQYDLVFSTYTAGSATARVAVQER